MPMTRLKTLQRAALTLLLVIGVVSYMDRARRAAEESAEG